jgi:hypothetical protein
VASLFTVEREIKAFLTNLPINYPTPALCIVCWKGLCWQPYLTDQWMSFTYALKYFFHGWMGGVSVGYLCKNAQLTTTADGIYLPIAFHGRTRDDIMWTFGCPDMTRTAVEKPQ